MNNHYNPEPVVIAERHKFWIALQEESEAVCDFIVRLQKLARTCGFGEFLQEALRDRLVSGLHPKMKKTQCHLLAMRDLSFQTAKDKCVADELAMKANDLHMGAAAKGDVEVNLLQQGMNRGHRKLPRASQGLQNMSTMTSPTTKALHTGVKAHQMRPLD